MTLVLYSTKLSSVSVSQGSRLTADVSEIPRITVSNASPYIEATVTKILAAKRGKNAAAPADKDQFLDWLNA